MSIKDLPDKLAPITDKLRRYSLIICIVTVAGIYSFLVWRINLLASSEPSEEAVTEKLQEVKRPKIDKKVVDKIRELETTNVEVQTLFKQARDNPFQDN